MFRMAVFTAAAKSGRKVRILHQLTQPADHPVDISHPEGEYLKGLVLLRGVKRTDTRTSSSSDTTDLTYIIK